ncbi:MAG: hypothetical protein KF709_05925 [Gemmatimonadaceae bacterium]|nr:hypothetical protein [Gemmatimonadaceae bacterium]
MSSATSSEEASSRSLRVVRLDDRSREAAIAFARSAWDRPCSDTYFDWRYRQDAPQEAALAMNGDECVGGVFAFRRPYLTPDGERDCLEMFDWYADDVWRARGAGLRVIKEFMRDGRPLLALGGTPQARAIFERLKWTRLDTGWRLNLPLTGRYFRDRGRTAAFAAAFDLSARHLMVPRARASRVQLVPAGTMSPSIAGMLRTQGRFAWIRLADPATDAWLRRAPASFGTLLGFHVRSGGRLVGWASARIYEASGLRTAAVQELFLADDATSLYGGAARELCRILVGFSPDVITAATSCRHSLAALQRLRFRRDYDLPIYCWTGTEVPTPAATLADGAHAEWAFFPLPTAAEAAWLDAR